MRRGDRAVAAGIALRIDADEWRWLILAIALVIAGEAMNTGIEQACDAIGGRSEPIRHAKDAAAGGVLVLAIAAVLIGFGIFVPHLIMMWHGSPPLLPFCGAAERHRLRFRTCGIEIDEANGRPIRQAGIRLPACYRPMMATNRTPDAAFVADESFVPTSHKGITYPFGGKEPGEGGAMQVAPGIRWVRLTFPGRSSTSIAG